MRRRGLRSSRGHHLKNHLKQTSRFDTQKSAHSHISRPGEVMKRRKMFSPCPFACLMHAGSTQSSPSRVIISTESPEQNSDKQTARTLKAQTRGARDYSTTHGVVMKHTLTNMHSAVHIPPPRYSSPLQEQNNHTIRTRRNNRGDRLEGLNIGNKA